MHAVDTPGSVGGQWANGDPTASPPVPATELLQDWFNDYQGNLLQLLSDAGISPTKLDLTQISKSVQILGSGGPASGAAVKNLLANSDFWLFRRGTAPGAFTGVKYVADRWRAYGNGPAGCTTISQVGISPGANTPPAASILLNDDFAPPANPVLQWVQGINGTGISTLEQRSDMALGSTSGQQVTFSIWLRTTSGSVNITPEVEQNFGASGSTAVVSTGSAWTVTTTWTRFSYTLTLGSLSGKTLGAAYYLALRLKIPSGATFTFQCATAQFEIAPLATPYKHPGYAIDFIECSRFFQSTYERSTAPGSVTAQNSLNGYNSGTDATELGWRFPVTMRAVPTIVFYAASDGSSGFVDRNGPSSFSKFSISGVVGTGRGFSGYPITATNTGTERAHCTADAEL